MAKSFLTGMPVKTDTIEVTIARPALGPSFGVAPSGHEHGCQFYQTLVV